MGLLLTGQVEPESMAKIAQVLVELEKIAPRRFAYEFDKVGLQVGDETREITRAAVSLDRSLGAIRFAKENECQLLLSHHPLLFNPLSEVTPRSHTGRSVLEMVRAEIAFIAAHTNWDCALGGINDVLATLLGLEEVRSFGSGANVSSKKLVFHCPEEHLESIVERLAEVGAGVIGAYHQCSFSSRGVGRFLPGEGTSPMVGEPGKVSLVDEFRVEMVLPQGTEGAVERTLLKVHPYERPSYDIYPLTPRVEQQVGRVGRLKAPVFFREFLTKLDACLSTVSYGWGDPSKNVKTVAVVGGAADGEWIHAQRAGADVLVTGEVKQHVAVEASESGLCIVAAGHFATENPGALELGNRMAHQLPEIEWLRFTPDPGLHGRPLINA